MQNQEQWDFAQIYSAKLLIKFGLVLCLSSILGCMFTIEEPFGLILSMVLLLTTVVLLLIFTEKAINKKFNL